MRTLELHPPRSLEMHAGSPHRRDDLLGQMQTFPLSEDGAGAPGGKRPLRNSSVHPFLQLQLALSGLCVAGRSGLVSIAAHFQASVLLLLTPCDGGDCVIGAAQGASRLL